MAPAATPAAVVDRIQQAVAKALQEPAVRARLAGQGLFPPGSLPDEFAAQIKKKLRRCSASHGLQKSALTDASG